MHAIAQLIEADGGRRIGRIPETAAQNQSVRSRICRDTIAMLEALAKIRYKHARVLDDHTLARIRRQLSSHRQASLSAARDDGAWKKRSIGSCAELQQGARRWRPAHRRFGALAAGIRVAHRLGRKAMAPGRGVQSASTQPIFTNGRNNSRSCGITCGLSMRRVPTCEKTFERLHLAGTWLGRRSQCRRSLCAALLRRMLRWAT